MHRTLSIALLISLSFLGGGLAMAQSPTPPDCGGHPDTGVIMATGLCLGQVWKRSGNEGPRLPRGLLPLDGGDWLVTDLGSWDPERGSVWRMRARPDGTVTWILLLSGLSMPHTIARGPDGRVYVGEMSEIFAFDPEAANPQATVATVVEGLPDNRLHENRHPLSSFLFDVDGTLLVNVGAPSDRCLDVRGRPYRDATGLCAESAEAAGLRRYAYLGRGRWSPKFALHARGLRNSLAMARHSSGAVYQAENSVDLPSPTSPYDEINRIAAGGHYGWPYCVDLQTRLPGWTPAQARCEARKRPVALLPPHSAPLAMLYYDGAMFPELHGRMLISLHGHRRTGGRILAAEVDAEGAPVVTRGGRYPIYPRGALAYPADAPSVTGRVLTPGWDGGPGRARGSPVGMAVASDGSIWVADDRSAAILRIARSAPQD